MIWPFSWLSASPPRFGGQGDQQLADHRQVHLVLYKFDRCPYCRRVYRTIDKLHVNVEYRDVRADSSHRAELKALTGGRQVPCLVVDGVPMLESTDIVRWFKDNVPEPTP